MVNGWLTCLNDNPPPLRPGPIEVRPRVGTALAADLADETMLYVAQPDIIGPAIAADRIRSATDSGWRHMRGG